MNISKDKNAQPAQYTLRSVAMLAMGFFLTVSILTALVVIPKINSVLASHNTDNVRVDLALEAELFTQFVESQKTILEDLAQFPSLVNAAMMSDTSDPVLVDFVDNIVIGGESGRIVLQDIEGNVLIKSAPSLQASYDEGEPWVANILDADVPYHFQLLGQSDNQFSFKVSIPVKNNDFIEGVLSAEITALLDEVFLAQTFDEHIAFRLVQNETSVYTRSDHIEIAHEESVALNHPDLTFIYITDAAIIKRKEMALRTTIFQVLLTGLAISFLLFVIYGYLTQSDTQKVGNGLHVFSRAYTIPIVIAVIGAATSFTAFLMIYSSQGTRLENQLTIYGKEYVHRIQANINRNLDRLDSIASFYDASEMVDRKEFSSFTKSFISSNPNIQALAWVPNVVSHERPGYEDQARVDGIDNFEFKELGANAQLEKAGIRDQYFPVYYIAPMEGNEKVFGFDLASQAQRLDALSKASRNREMVASAPIQLVGESANKTGILFFYPVFRDANSELSSASSEYDPVRGYVLLVLRASDTLNDSLENEHGTVSAYVQDITDLDNHEKLYGDVIASDEIAYSQSIDVAGRTWRIDTAVTTSDIQMQWIPWLVLASGLIATLLITLGLVHLIRRREVVELMVEQRTAELKMLSSIAANSNDIFIVTSADELVAEKGGPEILYVNDAFTRHTGYSIEDTIGNTPRMLQGANTDRRELDRIRYALQEKKSYQGELLNYTKENKEFWVDINIVPLIDDAGNTIQYASVQRDITDRKSAQKEREELIDKLSDSNDELARFAFVCSHDLQEPLRMIRSFSEKLQAHISADLVNDPKGQKYFHFITDGAARAQELIADILCYSSIDSDTEQLQCIDGNRIVARIRNEMQLSLSRCNGVITSDKLPDLQGNETQLFQLFQNIVNNAVKYQKKGISPSVHIGVTDAGTHWQFSIKDNGIGMEQRHLSKIFDVFQRLHRKSQYAGTGVGLSICKKVVTRHGGNLWVESEQGVGSTFYFTLLKPVIEELDNEPQRKAG